MPRKAFIADLQDARTSVQPASIYDLRDGDEDGSITFLHRPPGEEAVAVVVQAQVTDVADYPKEHCFFVYTTSENVPPEVNACLSDPSLFRGLKVSALIAKVARVLDVATAGSQAHPIELEDDDAQMDADQSDAEQVESDIEEYGIDFDDHDFADNPVQGFKPSNRRSNLSLPGSLSQLREHNRRVRSDIRAVKAAGFRFAHHGELLNHGRDCYLMLSCRVSKLGIPEDALRAWNLERDQYFMLLIRFENGYQTLDSLMSGSSSARQDTKFHVAVSGRHKVRLQEVIEVFSTSAHNNRSRGKVDPDFGDNISSTAAGSVEPLNTGPDTVQPSPALGQAPSEQDMDFRSLFIGQPLNELLNNRFLDILRHRILMNLSWSGAEEFFHDFQGRDINGDEGISGKYWAEEGSNSVSHLPQLVNSDHLRSQKAPYSLPLLAMQFALRHLVRCTEFCLVCHCRVQTDFEALKPYVCSKPLCLYQYMALGFGPSIEHEVLHQPHVVDLLVSFCYSSARFCALRELPIGMGLSVPAPSLLPEYQKVMAAGPGHYGIPRISVGVPRMSKPAKGALSKLIKAKYDERRSELLFPEDMVDRPVRVGDWLAISVFDIRGGEQLPRGTVQHQKVMQVCYPNVRLGRPTSEWSLDLSLLGTQPLTPEWAPPLVPLGTSSSTYLDVDIVVYSQNFDDLDIPEQQDAISLLLGTLPSVREMRAYLKSPENRNKALHHWSERLSPAALGILRWIIASNRSCIIQIDNLEPDATKVEDRCHGMPGFMQFRFAQGAPDKEQRFISSVRETSRRLNLKVPTIFAWHGSPLYNWHGIVRAGLNYNQMLHGRAYGDGVYHSLDANTSLGYTMGNVRPRPSQVNTDSLEAWPKSELKISHALVLNEIVNAPTEFRSRHPHLVVQNVDWIQTRYLFVRCAAAQHKVHLVLDKELPTEILEQDATIFPTCWEKRRLIIPLSAISKSRRPSFKQVKNGNKKAKVDGGGQVSEEDLLSDDTDVEDMAVLLSDDETEAPGKESQSLTASAKTIISSPETDFIPGILDFASLPVLPAPPYATSQATKAIQREIRSLLKTQASTPAHEIGWYLEPNQLDNVYQLIIELHSFEPTLPLAKDMKANAVRSIILELRFGATFPFAPPFVRVVRPRFLPFQYGGGGHVTAGGAMCMQLLTNDGWNVASSIEAVLLQVRIAITSTEPRPARLERGPIKDYGVGEAIAAYKRACLTHGWTIPKDFDKIVSGG